MIWETYVLLASWAMIYAKIQSAKKEERDEIKRNIKNRHARNKMLVNKGSSDLEAAKSFNIISSMMKRFLRKNCCYAINMLTGELVVEEEYNCLPESAISTGELLVNGVTKFDRELLLKMHADHAAGLIRTEDLSREMKRIAGARNISLMTLNEILASAEWEESPTKFSVYFNHVYKTVTDEECNVTDGYFKLTPVQAYFFMSATRCMPYIREELVNSNYIMSCVKNNCPQSFHFDVTVTWDQDQVDVLVANYYSLVLRWVYPNTNLNDFYRNSRFFGYTCTINEFSTPNSVMSEIFDIGNVFDYFESIVIKHLTWLQIDEMYSLVFREQITFEEAWNRVLARDGIKELCENILFSRTRQHIDENIMALAKLIGLSDNSSHLDSARTLSKILLKSESVDVQMAAQFILSKENYLTKSDAVYATELIDNFVAKFNWIIPSLNYYKGVLTHISKWESLTDSLFRLRGEMFEYIVCLAEGLNYYVEADKPTLRDIIIELSEYTDQKELALKILNTKLINMTDVLGRKPDSYRFVEVEEASCNNLEYQKSLDEYDKSYIELFKKDGKVLKIEIIEMGWVKGTFKKAVLEKSRWASLRDFGELIGPVGLTIILADDTTIDRYRNRIPEPLFENIESLREFKIRTASITPPTHQARFKELDGGYVVSTTNNVNLDFPEFTKDDIIVATEELLKEKPVRGFEYIPSVIHEQVRSHTLYPFSDIRLGPKAIYEVLKKVKAKLTELGKIEIWQTEQKRDTNETIGHMWHDHHKAFNKLGYVVKDDIKFGVRHEMLVGKHEGDYEDICDCSPGVKVFHKQLIKCSRFKAVALPIRKMMSWEERRAAYADFQLSSKVFSMVTHEEYKYRLDMASRIVKIKGYDFQTYLRTVRELGAEVAHRKIKSFSELKTELLSSMVTLLMAEHREEDPVKKDLLNLIISWCSEENTYCPHTVIVLTEEERTEIWDGMLKAKSGGEILNRMMEVFKDRSNKTRKPVVYYTNLPEFCEVTAEDNMFQEELYEPILKELSTMHEDEMTSMTSLCNDQFIMVAKKYFAMPSTFPYLLLSRMVNEVDKCIFHTKTAVYRRKFLGNLDLMISTSASRGNYQLALRDIISKQVIWNITIDQTKLYAAKSQLYYNLSVLCHRLEASHCLTDFCEDDTNVRNEAPIAWEAMKPELENFHDAYLNEDYDRYMECGDALLCDMTDKYSTFKAAKMIEFINRISGPALMENYQPHNTALQQLRFPYMFSLSDRFSGREWGSKMIELNRRQACQLHSEWIFYCGFKALSMRDTILSMGRNPFFFGKFVDPLTGLVGKSGDDFISFMYSVHYYDREALNFGLQSINTMLDFYKPTSAWFRVSEAAKTQLNGCAGKSDTHLKKGLTGRYLYNQDCKQCKAALNMLSCAYQIPVFEVASKEQLKKIIYDQCVLSEGFTHTSVCSPYLQQQLGEFLNEHISDEDHDRVDAHHKLREPVSTMSDTTGCMKSVNTSMNPIKLLEKVYTKFERKTIESIRSTTRSISKADFCGITVKEMMSMLPKSSVISLATFFNTSTSGNELQAKEILTSHGFDKLGSQSGGDLIYSCVKKALVSFSGDSSKRSEAIDKFKEKIDDLPEEVESLDILKLLVTPKVKTNIKCKEEGFKKIITKLKKKFNIKSKDEGAPVNVTMLFESLYEEIESKGRCVVDELRDLIKKELKFLRLEKGVVSEVSVSVHEDHMRTPGYVNLSEEADVIIERARNIRNRSILHPKIDFTLEKDEFMRDYKQFMRYNAEEIKNAITYQIAMGTSHGLTNLIRAVDIYGIIFDFKTKAVLSHLMPGGIDALQMIGMNTVLFGEDFIQKWMNTVKEPKQEHDLQGIANRMRELMITMDVEDIKKEWLLTCLAAGTGRRQDLSMAMKNKKGEKIFLGASVHSKVIFQIIDHLDSRIGNSFHLARSFIHRGYRYQATNAPKSQFAARRELMVQTYETKVVNHCAEVIGKIFLSFSRADLMEHSDRKDEVLDECKKLISAKKEDPREFLYIASADEKKWGPNHCTMGFFNMISPLMRRHPSMLNLLGVAFIAGCHKEVAFPEAMLEKTMNVLMYKKLKIKPMGDNKWFIENELREVISKDSKEMEDLPPDMRDVLFDNILEGRIGCSAYNHMGQGIFHGNSSLAILGELEWAHQTWALLQEEYNMPECRVTELRSSDDSILVMYDPTGFNDYQEEVFQEFLDIRCIARKLGANVSRSEKSCGGHMIAEVYSKFCTEEDLIPAVKQTCAVLTSACSTSMVGTAQMLFNICSTALDEGASLFNIFCTYRMRMVMDKLSLTLVGTFDSVNARLPLSLTGRFPVTFSHLTNPLNSWECQKAILLHQTALIKLRNQEKISLEEAISLSAPIDTDEDILNNYKSQHKTGKSKLILGDLISRPEMNVVKVLRKKLKEIKDEHINPMRTNRSFIFELLNTRGQAKSFEGVLVKVGQVLNANLLPDALAKSRPIDRLQMMRTQILGKFVNTTDKHFTGKSVSRNGQKFVSIAEFDKWEPDQRAVATSEVESRISLMRAGVCEDLEVSARLQSKEKSSIEAVEKASVDPVRLSAKVFRGDVIKRFQLPLNVLFCGILSIGSLVKYEPDVDLSKFNADELLLQTTYPSVYDYLSDLKIRMMFEEITDDETTRVTRLCEVLTALTPKARKLYLLADSTALYKDVPTQLCKYNVIRGCKLIFDEEPFKDNNSQLLAIQDYDDFREALTIFAKTSSDGEGLRINISGLMASDPAMIDKILFNLKNTSAASAKQVMSGLKLFMNGMMNKDDISQSASLFCRTQSNEDETAITDTITLRGRRDTRFFTMVVSYRVGLSTEVKLHFSSDRADVVNALINAYLGNDSIRHKYKPKKPDAFFKMISSQENEPYYLNYTSGVWKINREEGVQVRVSRTVVDSKTLSEALALTRESSVRVNGGFVEFGHSYTPLNIPKNELLNLRLALAEMTSQSSAESAFQLISSKTQEPFFSVVVRVPMVKSVNRGKLLEAKQRKRFEELPKSNVLTKREVTFTVSQKVADHVKMYITPDEVSNIASKQTLKITTRERGLDVCELLDMIYNTDGKELVQTNLINGYMKFSEEDVEEIRSLLGIQSLSQLSKLKSITNQIRKLKEGQITKAVGIRYSCKLSDGKFAPMGKILIETNTSDDLRDIKDMRGIDTEAVFYKKTMTTGKVKIVAGVENWSLAACLCMLLEENKYGENKYSKGLLWLLGLWHLDLDEGDTEVMEEDDGFIMEQVRMDEIDTELDSEQMVLNGLDSFF